MIFSLYTAEVINAATSRVNIKADMSMDIWSFGCTVYELYTRCPLFSNEQETTARLLEAYNTGHFDLLVNRVSDPQARHVLQKLLTINPMKRVSIEEILRGAYLTILWMTNYIWNYTYSNTNH